MRRPLLVAAFALSAGALSLPALSAGTNEISAGDSPATGMTGTGSNAMDYRVNPSTGSSAVVVPAAPVVTPVAPAVAVPATPGTAVVVPPNTSATVVTPAYSNAIPDPRVNRDAAAAANHGAYGGESAGKSSDSPAW
jgi:hypothetical protein